MSSPWSPSQYEHIKNGILTDIQNLKKEINVRTTEVKESVDEEAISFAKERLEKLHKWLRATEDNLRRFEFKHTHNGKGPEEWGEDEEAALRRAEKKASNPKPAIKIDYSKINAINPKTGKRYSNARIRTLVLEGKIKVE